MLTTHRHRTHLAAFVAAALLAAACSGDDDNAEPAASGDDTSGELGGSEEATDDPAASDDTSGEVGGPDDADDDTADDAADATDEPDEPDEPPFDPTQEVAIHDYEVVPFMSDEVVQPFEQLAAPTDLVLPATTALVTWEETEGWTSQNMATSGALRIHEGDTDTVMGFFHDRLPDQGWELVDEEVSDDSVHTVWEIEFPIEDGHPAGPPTDDADWVGETTLRLTYLGANEPGTLQFRLRTDAEVEFS